LHGEGTQRRRGGGETTGRANFIDKLIKLSDSPFLALSLDDIGDCYHHGIKPFQVLYLSGLLRQGLGFVDEGREAGCVVVFTIY